MNLAPLMVMASSGVAALIIIALAIEDGMQGLAWHREWALRRKHASLSELIFFLDAELLYIAAAACALLILLCGWRLSHSLACGVICGASWDILAAGGIYVLTRRQRCNA